MLLWVSGCSSLAPVADALYRTRLYRDRPLGDVLGDMQVFYARALAIDPEINALRFTGYFLLRTMPKSIGGCISYRTSFPSR